MNTIDSVERAEILAMITSSVREVTLQARRDWNDAIGEETRLFGSKGLLDSLGLVTVVLDVEQQISDRSGCTISLADDRALSMERSPFRTVGTLADYVLTLLREANGDQGHV
jgi:acyl carrier protein